MSSGNIHMRLHADSEAFQWIKKAKFGRTGIHNHTMPNWINSCPNDQLALALNRMFSGRNTKVNSDGIRFRHRSRKMCLDVKRLLARFGIITTIDSRDIRRKQFWEVYIKGHSQLTAFRTKINICGKEKELFEAVQFSQGKPDPYEIEYVDGKPGYWDTIAEVWTLSDRPTAGLSVPKYQNYISDCLEHNTLLVSLIAFAVLMQPRRRIWIVAPDYSLCEKVFRELYNIFVVQLKMIVPGRKGKARNQKGEYYLETPWGSVLEAKSMQNPDSLAGEALDLVIVDEAALDPNLEQIWMQMLRPTLIDKEGSAMFISTPRGKNAFYKLFLFGETGKKQKNGVITITKDAESGVLNDLTNWSSFKKTSYDNPLLASSPEQSKREIEEAYREAALSGRLLKFKQEYLADFEAVSDSCFPQFVAEPSETYPISNVTDYKFHPSEGPIFAACDHNFARPAATLFAQVNKFNDIIIMDESFTPKTTAFAQGQQILSKERELSKIAKEVWNIEGVPQIARHPIRFQEIIADISGSQRQLSGRTAWDDIEAATGRKPKGLKQDRETGSNMIRLWCRFPRFTPTGAPVFDDNGIQDTYPKLFVNRNCVNLIYALSTTVFQKAKNGTFKEDYEATPEGYEGLIDALRYLLVYLFHDRGTHFSVMGGF